MNRIKKIFIFATITLIASSCIEPFSLDLKNQFNTEYVVYGQITDQEGYQTISVSMSSTISNPTYNPLSNCKVIIKDDHGNEFNLVEFEKGNYRVWMEKQFLIPGHSYQVSILTDSGVEIESDFDKMPECPEVDSIYYRREDKPTTTIHSPLQGVQFYIDVNAQNTNSHYFRWEIIETWEHRATYPMSWYWTGYAIIKVNPPDYSRFFCWSTQTLKNIYTLSTANLAQNRYSMHKLHYVDNLTQRLTYGYSLLVNQFAISESNYNYWEALRVNTNEDAGLYNIQPLRIKGNLKSPSNPQLNILGFFGATSVRSKRIFVKDVENLVRYYPDCTPAPPDPGDFRKGRPQYLYPMGAEFYTVGDMCVECNIFGGSLVKPSFWPL